MKMHSVFFAAAAIGASAMTIGLTAAPVHAANTAAEDVVVTGRDSDLPQAIVRYGDLDLRSEEGRSRLDSRVGYAARKLCGTFMAQEQNAAGEIKSCQSAVLASAETQVSDVLAAIESGRQLALGDTDALTLSAK